MQNVCEYDTTYAVIKTANNKEETNVNEEKHVFAIKQLIFIQNRMYAMMF